MTPTSASARDRLPPETFRLPVERIRDGWYSDAYFVSTKRLLEEEGRHPRVLVQVFQKRESLLGGIDEAIAILKLCSGHRAAAQGKPILFFPARHDHWLVQTGDGWAAHVAGAIGVSTDAQASWWGGRGVGTVPHSLIAADGGDTVAAARAFARRYAHELNVTVLAARSDPIPAWRGSSDRHRVPMRTQ